MFLLSVFLFVLDLLLICCAPVWLHFSTSSTASCSGLLCISFVFAQVFGAHSKAPLSSVPYSSRTKPGVNLSRRRLGKPCAVVQSALVFPIVRYFLLPFCVCKCVGVRRCVWVCVLRILAIIYVSMQCLWCFFLTTCTGCGIFWLVLRFNCVLRMLHTAEATVHIV